MSSNRCSSLSLYTKVNYIFLHFDFSCLKCRRFAKKNGSLEKGNCLTQPIPYIFAYFLETGIKVGILFWIRGNNCMP
ncbi:hypothetical protein XELAEV_18017577mg [Xenopus laevis]|uniref:Uncharacterized protein n=1 Tax=Xenopus laevis TaxID=8355 RepID=A0A974DBE9_XENLA|nr:hypothetical protein XELAEV_18017577mg [Xenopus laevis]